MPEGGARRSWLSRAAWNGRCHNLRLDGARSLPWEHHLFSPRVAEMACERGSYAAGQGYHPPVLTCFLQFRFFRLPCTPLPPTLGWLKAGSGGEMFTALIWGPSAWPAWRKSMCVNWATMTLSVLLVFLQRSPFTTVKGEESTYPSILKLSIDSDFVAGVNFWWLIPSLWQLLLTNILAVLSSTGRHELSIWSIFLIVFGALDIFASAAV